MQSLPHGWSAHRTPDGRWYYAHAPTNTTQWYPPHPSSSQAPPPPPPPPPPHAGPSGYPGYAASNSSSHTSYPPTQYSQPGRSPTGYQAKRPVNSPTRPSTHHPASQYVYNTPVEFKLKEKVFSLSGDTFKVKRTDTNESVFKVEGNAFSFRDSKTIMDMQENPIYKMQESIISLRGRMQILDTGTRRPVITLRKKGFIPGLGTSTIQAWSGAVDDGPPTYEIKGDFFRKDFVIREVATGQSIAQVRRKSLTLKNILLDKDSYFIRVEPGRDAALVVFFVVAVDEQYRDDGERKGYGSLGSLGSFF